MKIAQILLIALVAMLLLNRLTNTVTSNKDTRVYRKEFRYYIIISLAAIAMTTVGLYVINPKILAFAQFDLPTFIYWIGCVLMTIGMILWLWSKQALGRNWSPRIAIRADHTLITSGPYYWVRHPIYTSYIIQVLGITMATANLAVILPCAAIASLTWHRVSNEEETLIKQFGDKYLEYRRNTGKLLPRIF